MIDFEGGSDIISETKERVEVKRDILMWIEAEMKKYTSDSSIFSGKKEGEDFK